MRLGIYTPARAARRLNDARRFDIGPARVTSAADPSNARSLTTSISSSAVPETGIVIGPGPALAWRGVTRDIETDLYRLRPMRGATQSSLAATGFERPASLLLHRRRRTLPHRHPRHSPHPNRRRRRKPMA